MTLDIGFTLKNYKSFGATGAGFEVIKPINVIVDRNNIGKSSLLQTLDFLCSETKNEAFINSSIEITETLDETRLIPVFAPNCSGG